MQSDSYISSDVFDIMNPRFNEPIFQVPQHFVKSRFHCAGNMIYKLRFKLMACRFRVGRNDLGRKPRSTVKIGPLWATLPELSFLLAAGSDYCGYPVNNSRIRLLVYRLACKQRLIYWYKTTQYLTVGPFFTSCKNNEWTH